MHTQISLFYYFLNDYPQSFPNDVLVLFVNTVTNRYMQFITLVNEINYNYKYQQQDERT